MEERNVPPRIQRYEVQREGKIQGATEGSLYYWRFLEQEINFYIHIFHLFPTGIHLTGNAYVPTYLLKDLAATEYKGELNLGKLFELFDIFAFLKIHCLGTIFIFKS